MAKKSASNTPAALSFRDIVLCADAETIRQALEARVRIDELIAERQAAYERIAALETQVEEVIGEPGIFPFPAPPLPVAGVDPKADTLLRVTGSTPAAPGKKSPGRPPASARAAEAEADDDEDNEDDDANPPSPADAGDADNDSDEADDDADSSRG